MKIQRRWRLTLLGRSIALITAELIVNTVFWLVAGLLFARREETRGVMSLALLAWTIGLRHEKSPGLDADHISAIDNATRGLIGMGQLPVTCGLFFSLGHSTIVIVVNVAIAISTTVYDKINSVGSVGEIIGAAVSGSFLFIIALANSIILYRILRDRKRRRKHRDNPEEDIERGSSIMMKVIGPVTSFVDKPWKMYPVGVLFGFGFDTASSIALLAVSALAKKSSDGKGIAQSDIVILPFLFTAGMTLVDSADSILMLYAYAGAPDKGWSLFEKRVQGLSRTHFEVGLTQSVTDVNSRQALAPPSTVSQLLEGNNTEAEPSADNKKHAREQVIEENLVNVEPDTETSASEEDKDTFSGRRLRVKNNTMSNLSIALTLVSILVAFSISLITIMGLIGDNCASCIRAAEAPDGGGLAGSWWRGWAKANDNSGYIGAAIVGGFVVILSGWYGGKFITVRLGRRERGA